MDCATAIVVKSFLYLQGYIRESWPIEFCNYLDSHLACLLRGLLTKLLLNLQEGVFTTDGEDLNIDREQARPLAFGKIRNGIK